MCGRYTLSNPRGSFSETPDIDVRFLAEFVETGWLKPRFNIAPTQDVPVITNEGSRRIERMRWGLVPFWAKDPKIGNRMINARAETLAEKQKKLFWERKHLNELTEAALANPQVYHDARAETQEKMGPALVAQGFDFTKPKEDTTESDLEKDTSKAAYAYQLRVKKHNEDEAKELEAIKEGFFDEFTGAPRRPTEAEIRSTVRRARSSRIALLHSIWRDLYP
ncbi:MAG: SOS response-associated peptidase family protein [Chloroflexi bacterium]|nr:SOS response-associated peptidase family protein [Chloroflexota bacterium]